VLATIDKVRKQDIAVVFITHNVRHALAVGDRFTVLNRGKTLGTAQRGQITPDELQDMMAGGQELVALEGSLGGTVSSRARPLLSPPRPRTPASRRRRHC
jgi:simple sugar transport system ATP-binding protein